MNHADGLKAELHEMYNVVQERDVLKKERDELKKEKKRLEYGIPDLLKLGDVNKTKLKNIKMIYEDEATVIELSGRIPCLCNMLPRVLCYLSNLC